MSNLLGSPEPFEFPKGYRFTLKDSPGEVFTVREDVKPGDCRVYVNVVGNRYMSTHTFAIEFVRAYEVPE